MTQTNTPLARPAILAIDTSSDACSVALSYGSETFEQYTDQPRKHAEWVLPMVDSLLAQAGIGLSDLDAIAYARGPGSFTGLRISAGVVQGLAFGAGLPVVQVSTLAILAHRGFRIHGWQSVLAAIDARMGEIYWGCYQISAPGDVVLCGEEHVTAPAQLNSAALTQPCYGVGSGWTYKAQIEAAGVQVKVDDASLLPHAQDLLTLAQRRFVLGETVQALDVAPVYLRNNVAAKPMNKDNKQDAT